ncbi:MAG TPA: helix-turn-helix domain-containing protein, partial [archaeon]|nr:helix-turn-helix domain-containing protein [archaeon]
MENNIEKKIIDTLSRHPEGLTIVDISREIQVHRNTVSKYIFALVRSNVVTQRRIGVVSICHLSNVTKPEETAVEAEKEKKKLPRILRLGEKSLAKISIALIVLSLASVFIIGFVAPIFAGTNQTAELYQPIEVNSSLLSNFSQKLDYELGVEIKNKDYFVGDSIELSGWFRFINSTPVEGQTIEISVLSNETVINQIIATDADGRFSFLLPNLEEGARIVTAYANFSNESVDVSLPFKVSEFPFIISLEKNQHLVNETVSFLIEGRNDTEFILTINGSENVEMLSRTSDDGKAAYNASFSAAGNYTVRIGDTAADFEVILPINETQAEPEIVLNLSSKEFYFIDENISIIVQGTPDQNFSLTVEKNGATALSVFEQTNSSGYSEISFNPLEVGNYQAKINYDGKEDSLNFDVGEKEEPKPEKGSTLISAGAEPNPVEKNKATLLYCEYRNADDDSSILDAVVIFDIDGKGFIAIFNPSSQRYEYGYKMTESGSKTVKCYASAENFDSNSASFELQSIGKVKYKITGELKGAEGKPIGKIKLLKAGHETPSADIEAGKYDLELETDKAKVYFKGVNVKKDIVFNAWVGNAKEKLKQGRIATPVFAFDDSGIEFDSTDITLEKTGDVNKILKCENWNFDS